MKISSKTKYAVKIVEFLANKESVKGKDIIEHLECSAPYFEQISQVLIKYEFVKTTRGCRGGYSLAKGSETKTMWDLIEAFNGKSWEDQGSTFDILRDKFIEAAKATTLVPA